MRHVQEGRSSNEELEIDYTLTGQLNNVVNTGSYELQADAHQYAVLWIAQHRTCAA